MFFITLTSVTTSKTKVTNDTLDTYLERLVQNDQAALSDLYYATSTSIYAYLLSVLKNTQDAEDILQECYLHIFTSAHLYHSQGKPLAWMISIAKNLCLQLLRERKHLSDLPQEDWMEYVNTCESASEDDRIMLNECMKTLNDEERQIIILHAVAGFKHREIAEVLQLPLSTVLSKYHRAIKKLKTYYR